MPVDAAARLRHLARAGALDLPLPGAGATPERLRALRGLGATEDLSVARLGDRRVADLETPRSGEIHARHRAGHAASSSLR